MKQQENNFQYKNIVNLGFWENIIPELNTEVLIANLYQIKQTIPSVFITNGGGYQSPDFLHLNPKFYFLTNLINHEIFKLTNNPNTKVESMWGNISSSTHFNHPHTHSYSLNQYSGIIYLKIPPKSGNLVFLNPLDISNFIKLIPLEKNLVIFQGVIPHYVEPNLSKEDRISIAFNFSK